MHVQLESQQLPISLPLAVQATPRTDSTSDYFEHKLVDSHIFRVASDMACVLCRVVRPVLGITIAPPQTLRQIGEDGVLILEVPYGTPAAKAGLKGTYRHAPVRFEFRKCNDRHLSLPRPEAFLVRPVHLKEWSQAWTN